MFFITVYDQDDSGFYKEVYGTAEYNAYKRDIIFATFYFSHPVTLELVSAPRLTYIEFFSNVGGLLGLFIGFSVISGIEILYWLTIGIVENCIDKKRSNKQAHRNGISGVSSGTVFELQRKTGALTPVPPTKH